MTSVQKTSKLNDERYLNHTRAYARTRLGRNSTSLNCSSACQYTFELKSKRRHSPLNIYLTTVSSPFIIQNPLALEAMHTGEHGQYSTLGFRAFKENVISIKGGSGTEF